MKGEGIKNEGIGRKHGKKSKRIKDQRKGEMEEKRRKKGEPKKRMMEEIETVCEKPRMIYGVRR